MNIIFLQIQWKGNLSTQSKTKPQETPKPQEQNHTIPHYTQKYLNRSDGVKWYLANPNVRQRCHQCNIFSQFQSYLWFIQPANQLEDTRCYRVLITKQGMAASANIENKPCRKSRRTLCKNLFVRVGQVITEFWGLFVVIYRTNHAAKGKKSTVFVLVNFLFFTLAYIWHL